MPAPIFYYFNKIKEKKRKKTHIGLQSVGFELFVLNLIEFIRLFWFKAKRQRSRRAQERCVHHILRWSMLTYWNIYFNSSRCAVLYTIISALLLLVLWSRLFFSAFRFVILFSKSPHFFLYTILLFHLALICLTLDELASTIHGLGCRAKIQLCNEDMCNDEMFLVFYALCFNGIFFF